MAGISPVPARAYMEPQAYLPAKLIFGGTSTPLSDPLEIAKDGINETLSIMPEHFNVRQILALSDTGASYVRLHDSDRMKAGINGFIFDPKFISANRVLFDGVREYVLMGGDMQGNLRTGFLSLLVLKGYRVNDKVVDLLKVEGSPNNWALDALGPVNALDLLPDTDVTFHFPTDAVYPKIHMLRHRHEHLPNAKWKRYEKWEDYRDHVPNYMQEIHEYTAANMPFEYWSFLQDSGLNIIGFVDGQPMKQPLSAGPDSHFVAKVCFWSSTDALFHYMRAKYSPAGH